MRCAASASALTTTSMRFSPAQTSASCASASVSADPLGALQRTFCPAGGNRGTSGGSAASIEMVAAGVEVAGAAALLFAAAPEASGDAADAAAAGPTAVLAGGTCNCESIADYTRGGVR